MNFDNEKYAKVKRADMREHTSVTRIQNHKVGDLIQLNQDIGLQEAIYEVVIVGNGQFPYTIRSTGTGRWMDGKWRDHQLVKLDRDVFPEYFL